jgi:AmiR/NasT family two-component response regulator
MEPSKLYFEQMPARSEAQDWRFVVAQATGVLMARFRIGSDAAIENLATLAEDTNRPLLDVAREIVEEVNSSATGGSAPSHAHRTIHK